MSQLQDKLNEFLATSSENSDHVTNWIAEAIGLSDRSLEGSMSDFSPMSFLQGHGATIHFSSSGALVDLNCHSCHKHFLLRVALLKPDSSVLGAKAYRVPGLKYGFTHAGGAGLLIKDGYNVGRFVWGTPTCACPKLEDVEIPLHPLPLPRPNNYEYGRQKSKEWRPILFDRMIKC